MTKYSNDSPFSSTIIICLECFYSRRIWSVQVQVHYAAKITNFNYSFYQGLQKSVKLPNSKSFDWTSSIFDNTICRLFATVPLLIRILLIFVYQRALKYSWKRSQDQKQAWCFFVCTQAQIKLRRFIYVQWQCQS